ncbi:MAG: type II toxin-antitoxin system VapC family toxin [Sphingomonas sp.]|uniref:type II toxin-antitoxin system VapC family toxin n=1 Tax=Sphingomonas sp. TaxID=28214 RepID=UPI0025DC6C2D|nr:type II toxin-antitoxin system VapC family toxin [Sphingomonas sp.]MBY0283682.1 type II toxin-antitoxin system VapC family toxin [Sphingomonas sp.]
MRYLLDANCVIQLLSGAYPRLTHRVADCDAGSVVVSSIAFAEVALGSAKGKPPALALLDLFIEEIPIVEFDLLAARAHATLPFKRANFDRLLAAQALSLGLTIVTNNEADFADVPGLKVENWTR